MGSILNPADLTDWVVAPEGRITQAIEDVEARAHGIAPCLASLGEQGQILAKAILRMVTVRYLQSAGGAIESQTSGPFSVKYRHVEAAFTDSDRAELAKLCGVTSLTLEALPRGSSPEPRDYDPLFARPRRWIR